MPTYKGSHNDLQIVIKIKEAKMTTKRMSYIILTMIIALLIFVPVMGANAAAGLR